MAPAKPTAEKDYDDIPGTYVFDADRSRQGYHLNMFCMSLMKAENRKAFKADEAKYLDQFPLTPEQREAILKRQYNRMLELGGNIYFTAKLGATDGHPFQHLAARDDRLDPAGLRRPDAARRPLGRRQPQPVGQVCQGRVEHRQGGQTKSESRTQQGKETPWLGSSQE